MPNDFFWNARATLKSLLLNIKFSNKTFPICKTKFQSRVDIMDLGIKCDLINQYIFSTKFPSTYDEIQLHIISIFFPLDPIPIHVKDRIFDLKLSIAKNRW